MKNTWILLVGVILGLIAGGMAYKRLNQNEDAPPPASQSFLRLMPDVIISKGDVIRWEDLEEVNVPADFEPLSSIAVESSNQVRTWLTSNEVRANKDLVPRSFLLTEAIIDLPEDRFVSGISVDRRAITIPVSEVTAVAFFVEPGSRVDVLVTIPRSDQAIPVTNSSFANRSQAVEPEQVLSGSLNRSQSLVTKTLLQNMRVLAVGRTTSREGYLAKASRGYGTVTLDATPEEAEIISFVNTQARGGMHLVLRNPLNSNIEDIENVDWKTISDQ